MTTDDVPQSTQPFFSTRRQRSVKHQSLSGCTDCLYQHAVTATLWHRAEKACANARFELAAGWLTIPTTAIFDRLRNTTFASCLRKAALCLLHLQRYEDAANLVRKCPMADDASSHYVLFLISTLRGDEEPGSRGDRSHIAPLLMLPSALFSLRQLASAPNLKPEQ